MLSRDFLYTPGIVAMLLLIILAIALLCNRFARGKLPRILAWSVAIAGFWATHWISFDSHPLLRMTYICFVLLYAMKALVLVEHRLASGRPLPLLRCIGFVLLWPGMLPELFVETKNAPGAGGLIANGFIRLIIGAIFLAAGHGAWRFGDSHLLATILVLPGLSLVLHFGMFNTAAGLWRMAGVECEPLFRAPLLATSLSEFWGRRWNLAFSQMTKIAVYQPLSPHWGKSTAAVGGFLFSGVLHELAISVPVKACYGLPLGYFAVHGALIIGERALFRRGWAIDRKPWIGRIWTIGWLVLPMPILFHLPFLRGVVWPLVGIQ